ncbi:hypothetical protein F5051DRAFT_439201 [Lentinula edodes]|nr:hypothetical protein F5051DRAFT_439201 [Lentinula edodes]
MLHSCTQTVTTPSSTTAGPSRSRPTNLPSADPVADDDEAIRQAEEKVRRMKARKAAAAAKKKAEEEAARKAAEEAQRKKEAAARELEERRRKMAEAATAWGKGKGKAKSQPVGGDPNNGGDGDDNDEEDDQAPCERCRSKKISCQMQAGKRSSIICKPCHDTKVKCSYSCLAVLESQVAQLLADNWQLRDGQVKANTYHRHFNCKLDWLITDAARRRRTPPEIPEAGPLGLSRKRRRVMDNDEEEKQGKEEEEDGEGEEEEGEDGSAPRVTRSEKGKEREE